MLNCKILDCLIAKYSKWKYYKAKISSGSFDKATFDGNVFKWESLIENFLTDVHLVTGWLIFVVCQADEKSESES